MTAGKMLNTLLAMLKVQGAASDDGRETLKKLLMVIMVLCLCCLLIFTALIEMITCGGYEDILGGLGDNMVGISPPPIGDIILDPNGFINPAPQYVRVSSEFGRRNTGIAGASTNHKGIDLASAKNSPIVASASGVVVFSGYQKSRGYYVKLQHSKQVSTIYQHNTSNMVAVGQTVVQGEQIARAGNTGVGSGSHCHFEIIVGGIPVNPRGYVAFEK